MIDMNGHHNPHLRHACGPRRAAPGFTLVELLTAMAILGLIVALLFAAFNSASDVTMRNANKVEGNQAIRAVLDLISRDLSRATYSSTCMNMLQTNTGTLSASLGIPTNTLYFLSDQEPDCNSDGYVSIGYQIAFDSRLSKYVLQREDDSLVDPVSNPGNWWTTFFTNNLPTTDANYLKCFNTNQWKTLSENIIGIQFTYFTNTADHTQYRTDWPATLSNQLPYSVGVQIYTLDTDTYNKALRIDPNLGAGTTNLIWNNVRVFYTRVFVPHSTRNL